MERYLRVNLLGPGPRLLKKEFTGPRSHKGYTDLESPTEQEPLYLKMEIDTLSETTTTYNVHFYLTVS